MFSRLVFFVKKHFLPDRLKVDRGFMLSMVIIIVFGLIMLSSASSIIAYSKYNDTYFQSAKQALVKIEIELN